MINIIINLITTYTSHKLGSTIIICKWCWDEWFRTLSGKIQTSVVFLHTETQLRSQAILCLVLLEGKHQKHFEIKCVFVSFWCSLRQIWDSCLLGRWSLRCKELAGAFPCTRLNLILFIKHSYHTTDPVRCNIFSTFVKNNVKI